MWHPLNNYLSSVQTYSDLSPDLTVRQQVNGGLRRRRALKFDTWCSAFQRATAAQPQLLQFIYVAFQQYSGLDFSRVRPQDRLIEDLRFPLVCWFDWTTRFCDDFIVQFGVDLSDIFDEAEFVTLADIVIFLQAQIAHAMPSHGR